MNALSWLNDLMTWLGRWVPRIILEKGELALWFGPGGRTRALSPGLYVYWPITSDVTVVSTKLRTLEINGQVNGREVLTVVVSWRIHKPEAILHWDAIPGAIDDRTSVYLARHCRPGAESDHLTDAIVEDLRAEFGPSGLEIACVGVTQRGPVLTLRMMSEWGNSATRL